MNHSNFHFTQIPDKTNDVIFLKSPETLFLRHFWSFLSDFFSQKNPALSHRTIYEPLNYEKNRRLPVQLRKLFGQCSSVFIDFEHVFVFRESPGLHTASQLFYIGDF